jgi:hypothetical protein
MNNYTVWIASFLALTLVSSVFSSAFALTSSLQGPGENGLLSAKISQDSDDDDKKGKGNGGNNSGKGKGSDEDKEKEKDKKNKGKKIEVKSKKGGGSEVSEHEDNDESLSQQARSEDDAESESLLFPTDFTLKADNGIAVARGDGRNAASSRMDVSIDFNASTVRLEGNHVRVAVQGTISLDEQENALTDGRGLIIFFKNSDKEFFRGILHITGKVADDDGKQQKFHLRAFLLPPNSETQDEGQWAFVVKPAAKFGPKVRLMQLSGELIQVSGDNVPTPAPNKKLDRFSVSTISSPVTAGVLFNVTVTALDSDGNVLKSYNGKANVTDLTGTARPKEVSNFVNGIFSGKLNITKSMDSDKLTFTDAATGKKGTSNTFDVKAGALAKLDLTPSTAIAQPGDKISFVAKGLDKFGNEKALTGLAWSLSSPDFGSIATSGSSANFTASSSISTERNVTLTATVGTLHDSSKITIRPLPLASLDHFVITAVSSPKVAGSPFAISISAVTSTGATVTSYSGPIEISDTTGTLEVSDDNGFSAGVWTGSVNITKASTSVQLKVQHDGDSAKNGSSNTFEVVPGNLDHFNVSEIAGQTAGAEFQFNVTASDTYGNTIKNFNGTVTVSANVGTSPAGNASQISPNPYTYSSASDHGVHTFKAKLYNATEDAKITVEGSGKSGSSNDFDLVAGAVDNVTVSPSDVTASPGQNVTFTAKANDAFGNMVTDAAFNWTQSSPLLGSLNTATGTSVQFTATAITTETLNGAVTATSGSKSGTATIQVTAA